MLTLWDLIPRWKRSAEPSARSRDSLDPGLCSAEGTRRDGRISKRDLYRSMAEDVLSAHGIRVRRWRSSMTGMAWEARYRDGSSARMIEAPRPKGPMSAAVFLHEVGHHVIGLGRYRPRCLEEYHAWEWALKEMNRRGIAVTEAVQYRMHLSLAYAVSKAWRRGIRRLPAELTPFVNPPPWRERRRVKV